MYYGEMLEWECSKDSYGRDIVMDDSDEAMEEEDDDSDYWRQV